MNDTTLDTDFFKKLTLLTGMIHKDDKKYFAVNGIPNQVLNKAKIGKSNIHGNGVFSNSAINEKDIITCYPCEWVRKKGTNISLGEPNNKNSVPCDKYAFNIDNVKIYGNKDKYHNTALIGHIINDPCSSDIIEYIRTSNNTYENMLKYYYGSDEKVNAKFVGIGCFVVVIALKNIAPNEEILAHYDYLYWRTFEKNDNDCDKENKKFKKDFSNLNDKQKIVLANLAKKYVF